MEDELNEKDTPEMEAKEDATIVGQSDYENNVPKNYVPEGFANQEDFLDDMREEYQLDLDFSRFDREQALDDKKFSAGEQWDPVVLSQREGLPCLTINTIPQFIAQVVGDWRQNKNGIKVVPSEDGDVDIASIRGDLIRAIQTSSQAPRVYDNAFESMVTCGDGAFRISVDYARDDVFDQEINLKPIDDSLSVVWDRFSVDPTGRDAKRVYVDDLISEKEFNKKWPDHDSSTLSEYTRGNLYSDGWFTEAGVKITEFWRLIEREKHLGLFENGSIREITSDNIEKLIEKNGQLMKERSSPCLYAQMHLVTGFAILAGPYEYRLSRLPIIRMSGRTVNIAGRRVRHGLVRDMKDPARLRNFWRSVAAEQLGYAPKAQWIAPQSAVEGLEDQFRNAHLTRDPLLIYNDDASAPPVRLEPPAPQSAILNEANINAQDLKDVTGIHDASLGIRSNETSGRAIQARQREGDTANVLYYDNGNAALLDAGDVINQLISQVYDGTRIIRLIGEDEAVKFQKINDPNDPSSPDLSVGKYDIAMTSGTSFTTRRVEAAQSMMDAIQVWPQLIQVAGDIVAKAQDWPGADKLAERLKKTIPPQYLDEKDGEGNGPAIDPKMLQQIQMEVQTLQQENMQLKMDKSVEQDKVKVMAFDAETKRLQVTQQFDMAHTEMGVKTIVDILDKADASDHKDQDRQNQQEQATAQMQARQSQPPTT